MRLHVFVVVTLVLWGVIPIFDKLGLADKKVDPWAGICIRLLAGFAAMIPVFLASPQIKAGIAALGWREIAVFSASGIISLVVAQFFYYGSLQEKDVGKLFPILFGGGPVVTMVLAWAFLGEKVTLVSALGGLLVVVGSGLMFIAP